MPTSEIEQILMDQLHTQVLAGMDAVTLDRNTHLAESGILDSLGFIQFISFIEDRFNIAFQPDDYVPENLSTVEKLALLVARRSEGP